MLFKALVVSLIVFLVLVAGIFWFVALDDSPSAVQETTTAR